MNVLGGIGSEAVPVSGQNKVTPWDAIVSLVKEPLPISDQVVISTLTPAYTDAADWISWPGCTVRHIAVGRRTLCKRGLGRLDLTACALIGLDRPYCKACERVLGVKG